MPRHWNQRSVLISGSRSKQIIHTTLSHSAPRSHHICRRSFEFLPISKLHHRTHRFTMSSSFTNSTALFHTTRHHRRLPVIRSSLSGEENRIQRRNIILTTFVATSIAASVTPTALAQNWGNRSFLKERFFEPGLSTEDAAARIRQTAEGLHSIRDMLETRSWRYVIFYIRLKQSYLSQDMTNAITLVPQNLRNSYVQVANELVDNMAQVIYIYISFPTSFLFQINPTCLWFIFYNLLTT